MSISTIRIGQGALLLGSKPKDYGALEGTVDAIVCCLLPREYGRERRGKIPIIDAPFLCRRFPEDVSHIRKAIDLAVQLIADGRAVLVHCSAGIHRTGLVGYAILRGSGMDKSTAVTELVTARPLCVDTRRFIEQYGDRLV